MYHATTGNSKYPKLWTTISGNHNGRHQKQTIHAGETTTSRCNDCRKKYNTCHMETAVNKKVNNEEKEKQRNEMSIAKQWENINQGQTGGEDNIIVGIIPMANLKEMKSRDPDMENRMRNK